MPLRFLELQGKDSEDFLHRVTAGTVRGLEPGAGRPGLLLDGRSRVLAQFDLLRLAPDRFLLAVPEACAGDLASGLEALHFSENIEVTASSLRAGVVEAKGETRPEGGPFLFSAVPVLSWPSPVPGYRFSTEGDSKDFPPSWDFARIGALVPWPPREWSSATPALEAGMLPWIDRGKGCYPGQEVVELSLNVGHPARVLVAVESPRALERGEELPWGEAKARVTSAAAEGERFRGLVRVPWGQRNSLPEGFRLLRSHW